MLRYFSGMLEVSPLILTCAGRRDDMSIAFGVTGIARQITVRDDAVTLSVTITQSLLAN